MNTIQKIWQTSHLVISQPVITTSIVGASIAFTSTSIDVKTNAPLVQNQLSYGLVNSSFQQGFVNRVEKWSDTEYRQAYMEATVEQGLAWQIKANRKARHLTQLELAAELDTTQSAVSRLEDPEYGGHSLETLLKLANAFDCALSVRFTSYAQLAADSANLDEATLVAASFAEDLNTYLGVKNATRIEI